MDKPETLNQLRRLCNVSYKIITKIIATRLKAIMPKIVAPTQCSFVPGRHGQHCSSSGSHSFYATKGRKGLMAEMGFYS